MLPNAGNSLLFNYHNISRRLLMQLSKWGPDLRQYCIIHNILEQHWGVPLASPQQCKWEKIKNWKVKYNSDSGGYYVPPPVRYKLQPTNTKEPSAPNGTSMNNWGTMHKVVLSTSKLNSSDSQISRASIFWYPSTVEGHSYLMAPSHQQVWTAKGKWWTVFRNLVFTSVCAQYVQLGFMLIRHLTWHMMCTRNLAQVWIS
jgi:hypothetical protein